MMKKILGLSLIFAHLAFGDNDYSECDCEDYDYYPFAVFVPDREGGVEISASFLGLKPSSGNLGWGVITNASSSLSPRWHVESIDPDFSPAYIIEARYIFPCSGIDTRLGWTHLHSRDKQSKNVTAGEEWISPFLQTGLSPLGVEEFTSARARVKFYYDALNWETSVLVNFGPRAEVRFFSGLSAANIRQKLSTLFFNRESGIPFIAINNRTSFKGIGPRLGLETAYPICPGFDLVGQAAGSCLFGSKKPAKYSFSAASETLEAEDILVNDQKVSNHSVYAAVPSVDAKIAFKASYIFWQRVHFSIEFGYQGFVYLDCLDGYEPATNLLPLELGSLSAGSIKHVQNNFSASGPYLTLDFKF